MSFPSVRVRSDVHRITVEPASQDGFTVELSEAAAEYVVRFDGWHQRFESAEDAMKYFAFGLSGDSRLAVTLRGKTEVAWTLESRSDEGWVADSRTCLLLVPFWRPKRVLHRQNHHIDLTSSRPIEQG